MTAVKLTQAQAKALGVDPSSHAAAVAGPAPARPVTRRGGDARVAPVPYHTVCHDCAEQFRSRAAENRHLDTTRHLRYATVFTVTTVDDHGS